MPANENAPSVKKKGRRARLIVLVLVLALFAGLGYGAYWSADNVRASFPQTTGSLKVPSLAGTVDVKRDSHGIPQLYADSDEDLFRAQGFVHAQDRFWEMDVRRHMTSGRLSEMFGSGQVETDAFLRTLGWRQVAQAEYDTKLSPETKKYLQAYAEGVNAYLKGKSGKDLSVEHAALKISDDYQPEQWSPVDSVAWLKAMAWDLRGNMQDEIDRALMSGTLTPAQIDELYPPYPFDRKKPIVEGGKTDGGKYTPQGAAGSASTGSGAGSGSGSGTGSQASASSGSGTATGLAGNATAQGATVGLRTQMSALANTLDEIPAILGPNGSGIGSNSWVVSGKYTTTGKPLLANDPHLAPQLPSVWYQMGLHCRAASAACQYDVAGYTFSGMPGVVIGHNADIAWGMTNLGADVTDLYLEQVKPDGYIYDNKTVPFTIREEEIKVAGGKSKKITVRSTNNGPLISDRSDEIATVGARAPVASSAPDRGNGYAVALRWTALDPGKSMDAVFKLDRAKDFNSFRAAARDFEVPSQNLIYADNKGPSGNIGYQAPGRIPIRGAGDGRMPAPGWDSKYAWKGGKDGNAGYIPQDEMPYDLNPARGYIVTANQAVTESGTGTGKYPYVLTTDWGYGARSQRINDLIEAKIKDSGKISTDDMRTMQMDNSSEIAALLTPMLAKIQVSDPDVRAAQKLLDGWNYTQEPDSAAAAYFNAVWRNILKLSFGDKMPKELRIEGSCINVREEATGPVDDLTTTVRECGTRGSDSAQPDGGDRWFEVVRRLVKDEKSPWWHSPSALHKPETNTRDELFARAMKDARWELTAKLGKDQSTWSWGRLHQLMLKNQTIGTEGPGFMQWLLNRGPWNVGGGEATVNATGWNASSGYRVTWVPSMRMVVNLNDLDKSRWINLTGASGHAYHSHYTDQTSLWAKGELLEWPFGKEAVDKATVNTLTLKPGS
ncbi:MULTISPECIES: penicillin acylase family protein [unclassified Streptomyces]|uniref:penicillin acylase family protein n=1 Tax=unclassified Streptomyces TaxID=2593676 RepID=UPI001BE5B92B|nr:MULTISPECIES: penicillin acylase family protein [unclassified Streptomyces]MBT2406409.1 penicillin acylase family protein [Streptomyces sp. ISL-21]MBT2607495.1 penicillin acylase family protein [Streptomyces sp. ISL-87]